MDNIEFFDRFGIWIVRDFFPPEKMTDLLSIIRRSKTIESEVGSEYEWKVDGKRRSSRNVQVPEETGQWIRERMLDRKEFWEDKYETSLSGFEGPEFLLYHPGDFLKLHQDLKVTKPNQQRQVSLTLFLNDGAHDSAQDSFQGGQLVFHVSDKKNPTGKSVIPIRGIAGTLIAYRSDLFHEVKPVTTGERITVVGWLY